MAIQNRESSQSVWINLDDFGDHHVDIRGRKVKACNIRAYWLDGYIHVEGSDQLCEPLNKVHSDSNFLGRRLHVSHKSSNFFIKTAGRRLHVIVETQKAHDIDLPFPTGVSQGGRGTLSSFVS